MRVVAGSISRVTSLSKMFIFSEMSSSSSSVYTTVTETETTLEDSSIEPLSEYSDRYSDDASTVVLSSVYPQSSSSSSASSYRLLSNGTSFDVNIEGQMEEEEPMDTFLKFNVEEAFSHTISPSLDLDFEFCPICKNSLRDLSDRKVGKIFIPLTLKRNYQKVSFYTMSECGHSVCNSCLKQWESRKSSQKCMYCNTRSPAGYKADPYIGHFIAKILSFIPNVSKPFTFQCENCWQYIAPNYFNYFDKIYYFEPSFSEQRYIYCGFCAESFKRFGSEKRPLYRARFLELLYEKFFVKKPITKSPLFHPVTKCYAQAPDMYLYKILDLTIFDGYIKTVQLESPTCSELNKFNVRFPLFGSLKSPLFLVFPSYAHDQTAEIIQMFEYGQYLLIKDIVISQFPSITFLHVCFETKFAFLPEQYQVRYSSTPCDKIIDFFAPKQQNYYNEIL